MVSSYNLAACSLLTCRRNFVRRHMWCEDAWPCFSVAFKTMQIEYAKLTHVAVVVVLPFLYHSFVEHSSFISRDECIVGYRNIVAVVQFGRSTRHVSFEFGRGRLLLLLGPFRSAVGIVALSSVI